MMFSEFCCIFGTLHFENEENLAIFTVILMATFGTKSVQYNAYMCVCFVLSTKTKILALVGCISITQKTTLKFDFTKKY